MSKDYAEIMKEISHLDNLPEDSKIRVSTFLFKLEDRKEDKERIIGEIENIAGEIIQLLDKDFGQIGLKGTPAAENFNSLVSVNRQYIRAMDWDVMDLANLCLNLKKDLEALHKEMNILKSETSLLIDENERLKNES